MKLLHIQNLIYNRPLLISRDGFNSIHSVIQNKLLQTNITEDNIIDPEDNENNMTIENGIANIYINGPIGKHLSLLERVCGATDIEILREELDLASTYPDVETIVLNINSPGGSCELIPEISAYIAEINKNIKPITTLIDGMCCSAAYWLAAGSTEIISVGKTSTIGSIGCYCFLIDESRAYQDNGLQPILIKSVQDKGALMPGMTITDNQKQDLQGEVDYIHKLFVEHIKKYRNVDDQYLTGKSYMSEKALEYNLIDGIIDRPDQLFSK